MSECLRVQMANFEQENGHKSLLSFRKKSPHFSAGSREGDDYDKALVGVCGRLRRDWARVFEMHMLDVDVDVIDPGMGPASRYSTVQGNKLFNRPLQREPLKWADRRGAKSSTSFAALPV
ncbi:hypothetical protein B0H11DRAFT_1922413 [Mycena galericulata]|nr:hypothetical protein B0H11DRAFT_1922413 [Mycena galericulata]